MTARANLYYQQGDVRPRALLEAVGVQLGSDAGTAPEPVVVQLGETRIELAQMAAADRTAHLEALHEYLSDRCALEDPRLPATLAGARTAVVVSIEPGLDSEGQCARFLSAVAARTGAVVLRDDGTIADAAGRTLAYPATDQEDPLAFRREAEPPPPVRVARRALVLVALAWRGQLEASRTPVAVAQHAVWKAWVERQGLVEEMDGAEQALFASTYGTLTERQIIHCGWGIEGAAVLAWALRLLELPAPDTKVSPSDLASALGLFSAQPPALAAGLRPRADLAAMTARLFGVAWRLLRFEAAPSTFDFVGFSREAWFGGFGLEGVPVLEGDLAIRGAPISKAPPDAAAEATSIAVERFRAARWLDGRQAAWSEQPPVPRAPEVAPAPDASSSTAPDASPSTAVPSEPR